MKNTSKVSKIRISDSSYDIRNITETIRNRRSIYADQFIRKKIPEEILNEILINATWAPTHKMTEPWRFIIFQGKYLEQYGNYMAEYYRAFYTQTLSGEQLEIKLEHLRTYPLNAACLIGIIMINNAKIDLPKWEEVAAVSSAVQNIALTCTAHKIGSYWSSKNVAIDYVAQFGLAENETSLGLLYLGYYPTELELSRKKRTSLSKKVTFLK